MQKTYERKKVNFMINKEILIRIEELLPPGKRSDFINGILEEALTQYGREMAGKGIDELASQLHLKIDTDEIIELKNYGRL